MDGNVYNDVYSDNVEGSGGIYTFQLLQCGGSAPTLGAFNSNRSEIRDGIAKDQHPVQNGHH